MNSSSFNIYDWFQANEEAQKTFLQQTGWDDANITPVSEDCAMRRYLRLSKGGDTAILLESLPDNHPNATPGHKLGDFHRIGTYLQSIGLHVPGIYEDDLENGFMILEDLGDITFRKALDAGANAHDLYEQATKVLMHLRDNADPAVLGLKQYKGGVIDLDSANILRWYGAYLCGLECNDALVTQFQNIWKDIEKSLPPVPTGFLHIDCHLENLMWIPNEQGVRKCGILDFQQAMSGPLPYDLANLLGDARVEVSPQIQKDMLGLYCQDMNPDERVTFENWFDILKAQFHCRVTGLFVRMAVRDHKYSYLKYLPVVRRKLNQDLTAPVLKPIKDFLTAQKIHLDEDIPDFTQNI